MTLRPGIPLRREKGQPEGSAVTGKTRKPGVADPGFVPGNATSQNNSNLTPIAASVANGEWELILGIVPIIVLYTCHNRYLYGAVKKSESILPELQNPSLIGGVEKSQ